MKGFVLVAAVAVAVVSGCTTTKSTNGSAAEQAASSQPAPGKPVSSAPSAITGTPRPGSKFSKLKIGMSMEQVQTAMGSAPHRTDSHETGKRWIPFYFGADARVLEALYRGDGCLTFTGGNVWGGAGGELIAINNDPSGSCFEH